MNSAPELWGVLPVSALKFPKQQEYSWKGTF